MLGGLFEEKSPLTIPQNLLKLVLINGDEQFFARRDDGRNLYIAHIASGLSAYPRVSYASAPLLALPQPLLAPRFRYRSSYAARHPESKAISLSFK